MKFDGAIKKVVGEAPNRINQNEYDSESISSAV